jgi:hypothetical protein
LKDDGQLRGPEGQKIRADVDMLGLISKDDPPVFLGASSRHDGLKTLGDVNHNAKHSIAIKQRCDEAGVPAELKITSGAPDDNAQDGGHLGFLLKHLGVQTP